MSLRTENISLNCKKAYFQTIIENLHVGDVKSTQLVFTLTDGIKEIELPDSKTTAIIHGKKPDGTEIHNDCTVENNKIYYTLTAQDTAVSGIVDYMLDVTVNRDEQYERAYMPTFRTRVSDRIYSPAYRVLDTEPENWETEYKNYYRKEGNAYIQIADNVCPTFAPGTFYVLVDPPVESASEFLAFYSAFNKVSELFDKRLVIDYTTTDIEYSPDNIHKVFIYATIIGNIKGIVFTDINSKQYAICSDGLLRIRTYSGSYSDWSVVALNTSIDDTNKNADNLVPSIKAVVDYIATAISSKADADDVNAALATKANKTYVDTELGKKADINHSHPVDSEFSQTSTNPIENRKVTEKLNEVITTLSGKANTDSVNAALAGKANVNHTHDMSNYVTLQAMIAALASKADISDIPSVPTNVSAFNNDAGYITSSDIDLSGKANYREVNIENINNATNPNTVYRVSLGMNDGVPEYATIICPRSGDLSNLNHTQYAFTNLGRVLVRKCINDVWENNFTDLIPEGADVSGKADKTYVDTELNKKADKTEIPTKISAFTNDVGYLTQHQDISGKENTSNKKTEISSTHQSTEDTFYPTSGAVRRFVSASTEAQDEYNEETFAQKSTTLSGYGITDAYTKAEVDELITDTEKTPDYIKSEAARLAEVVRGHQGAGTITFIAASDFHDNIGDDKIEAGNKHALQAVKLLCERLKIDFVCGLGDYTWCAPRTNTTHSKGKSEIMAMVNGLINSASGKPMFLTTGNHDSLIDARHTEDSNGQYVYINPETDSTRLPIQAAEMFPLVEIYNCYNSKNSAGYGYKDFEDYKLRVICLNTTDVTIPTTGAGYYNTNAVGMSTEQAQWFADSLDLTDKEDCAEWKTIVVSHFPLDWGGLIPLVKIIKAFEDGTSGSISFGGGTVTYDYNGKNAAQIVAQFHGHVHGLKVDNLHYFDDNSVLKTVETQRIAIPNACFYRTNEYGTNGATENNGIEFGVPADGTTYAKTANTANDTAFNVITLDFANRKIYADNYGAGYNREITIPEWSFVPVVIPDYMKTDYIPTATDDSGSILNGVGYIDGKRLSTSGNSSDYRDVARCTTSGYIPIEEGNTLHFGGSDCVWTSTNASSVWSYSYIYLYDENKAPIAYIVTDQGAATPAIPLDDFNYYSADISPSAYTWKNSSGQTVNDLSGVRYCRVTVEGQGVNLRAYIEQTAV